MNQSTREALFDELVILAAAIGQTSYLLGFGVDPIPTVVVGLLVVGAGAATIVPARARVPAITIGFLGVLVAGAVVPVYAARAVSAGETLSLSFLLAGVVLLVTFAALRITTFGPRAARHA